MFEPMNATETKTYTRDEYLALEEAEGRRYDFLNGEIIDGEIINGEIINTEMGASKQHQLICSNIVIELGIQFKKTVCAVMASGMRVHTNVVDTYPDIVVVCGEATYVEPPKNTGRDTLTNPIVLMEVLSKSTRDSDRGDKFVAYRTVSTLTDFLAIDQDRLFVEHFRKIQTGEWLLREYTSADEQITLASINAMLTLKDIYDKTELSRASRNNA
jgi:Uma2 family endonuclease